MMPISRSISMWNVHDPEEHQINQPQNPADERTEEENEAIELRLDLHQLAQVLDEEMEPGNRREPERSCCKCAIL